MNKLFVLIFGLLFFQNNIFSQNLTMDSYEKARDIFNKSLVAYGGAEKLRRIENFSFRIEGVNFNRYQSRRPDIFEPTRRSGEITIDFKKNRYRFDAETQNLGGSLELATDILEGKELIIADTVRKIKTVQPADNNWRERLLPQIMPQFLLLYADQNTASLRYLGRGSFDSRPHDIIICRNSDGSQLSLYVDAETHLISKHEYLVSDPFSGDSVLETIFPAYQTIDKFKVPTEVVIRITGTNTFKFQYSKISIDKKLTDGQFKLDPDLKLSNPVPHDSPEIIKHANNVYTVRVADCNVLFVNFNDHIWVMEAPGDDGASREAIAKIKETIPNKPIKYLALTHFHDDHTGGARAYIAEGASIVTTKGNRSYFEQMVNSRFTITPDRLAQSPQLLKFEFVENKRRVFTDGTTTVELHEIHAGPHAEEMLIAYFPKEKILYEGDLLDRPSNGDYPIANPSTEHFAKWLETKELIVEKILPVHGTVTTIDELQKSIAERRR